MIVASPSDLMASNSSKPPPPQQAQTKQQQQQTVVFDFIVVGAGSAGCVVAARLAEDPNVRVLLVEAGTRATELEAKMPLACGKLQQGPRDWSLVTECSTKMFQGMKQHRFPYPRGKCLGGSSILNYMAYVRGSSKDYDTWERDFGATGWGWKHGVLPFFLQSEHNENINNPKAVDDELFMLDESFHGTNGPLAVSSNPTPGGMPQTFVRGAQELGGGFQFQVGDYNNGDNENKVALFQQTISKGKRCDTATAYIFNQPSKPNLTIVTNAQATRLLFDDVKEDAKKKVVGVELADISSSSTTSTTLNTTFQVHASKEVILSAGAIGSPQLLLLSGIGPSKELEALDIKTIHDLPHVGKNLEEHPVFPFLFAGCKEGRDDIGATNGLRAEGIPRSLPSLFNWLFRGKGLHATSAYDATLFYKTDDFCKTHATYGPNAQIGLFVSPGDEVLWQRNGAYTPAMDFAKTLYASSGPDPQGVIMVPTLLHSYSRGSVTLASKNPLAKPNVTLNLLDDKRDMRAMVDIMHKCLDLAKTQAMQTVLEGPVFPKDMMEKHGCTMNNVSDAFLMDFIRHYSCSLYHPTSTCKIGKVVDPQLRVLGLQGVRVADASVFPTNISGNTNAPSIMVGEKAADFIKKEYSLESTNVCTAPGGAPSSKVAPWMLLAGTVVAAAVVVGVGTMTVSKSRK